MRLGGEQVFGGGCRAAAARMCCGAVAAMLLALVGCGPGGEIDVRLRSHVEQPDPGVVVLLCDGLDPDLVEAALERGELPTIRRVFVEGGTRVAHAMSVVPSITYPALTSMLTGVSPAEHEVMGVWWFDRYERRFRNYATAQHYRSVNNDLEYQTLYELLQPATTASVQHALTRGTTVNFHNWAPSGVRFFFGDYTSIDKLTASTLNDVAVWANLHGVWPTMLMMYFIGVDFEAYDHGATSDEYHAAMTHLDYQLGRVCRWLEREGLLGTSYLVLISDHGTLDVGEYVDLPGLLRRQGRRVTARVMQNGWKAARAAHYDRYDTVVVHQSCRHGAIHLAGADGWDVLPSPATAAEILHAPPPELRLWNQPWAQLVAYLDATDRVVLRNERGVSHVAQRDGPDGVVFCYEPGADDVLGYLGDAELAAFVRAGFHDGRAWLNATCEQTLPDVVPTLGAVLRSRRGGQALCFPKPGYGFTHKRAGHGGVDLDEMRCTLYVAGPGVQRGGTIRTARITDLTPTLLKLLGRAPSPDDGFTGAALSLPNEDASLP